MDSLALHFLKRHPKEAARVIERVPESFFIKYLKDDFEEYEEILTYLSPYYLFKILQSADANLGKSVLEQLSPIQVVGALRSMPEPMREDLFITLDLKTRSELNQLLEYENTQIGYYVEHPKFVLLSDSHVYQALEIVDSLSLFSSPIFVVDREHHLLGLIDPIKLIKMRHEPNRPVVEAIKRIPITFSASTPLSHIVEHVSWNSDLVIPVIGRNQNFMGVISKAQVSNRLSKNVDYQETRTLLEEYLYLSELVWSGLQRLWGAFK